MFILGLRIPSGSSLAQWRVHRIYLFVCLLSSLRAGRRDGKHVWCLCQPLLIMFSTSDYCTLFYSFIWLFLFVYFLYIYFLYFRLFSFYPWIIDINLFISACLFISFAVILSINFLLISSSLCLGICLFTFSHFVDLFLIFSLFLNHYSVHLLIYLRLLFVYSFSCIYLSI